MGKAGLGRPNKPTNLALIAGDRKDRINTDEPIPAVDDVQPPEWLSTRALAEWHRLAPDLEAKGVLTAWDVQAFAEWCDAVATVIEATEHLEDEGYIVERKVFDRNGVETGFRYVPNDWQYVKARALEITGKRGARFGLTPAERASLAIDRGGTGDGKDPERLLS
ncbi:MAG: Phage terminase, small subunit [Acidimicrobiales bacterium]|nr:Phage terminase, small subunit [Acidimicrobiales bacterium]